MKILTPSLLAGLFAGFLLPHAAQAQGASQADLRTKYEDKLALEFVDYGGWITDYDEARAKAKAEGKVLFVYFSRSYSP